MSSESANRELSDEPTQLPTEPSTKNLEASRTSRDGETSDAKAAVSRETATPHVNVSSVSESVSPLKNAADQKTTDISDEITQVSEEAFEVPSWWSGSQTYGRFSRSTLMPDDERLALANTETRGPDDLVHDQVTSEGFLNANQVHVSSDPRGPHAKRLRWVVPLALVSALVMSCLTFALVRHWKNERSVSAPNSGSSISSSATASPSPSTNHDETPRPDAAPFPSDAHPTCLSPQGVAVPEADPNIQVSQASLASCAFLKNVSDAVQKQVHNDPDISTLKVSAWSPTTQKTYQMTCIRKQYLTKCTGARNVTTYIQDLVAK